jgi:hypothetical protein
MSDLENYLPISLPSKCITYDGIKPGDIKIRAYQGRDQIYLAEINPINLEQKYLQVLKSVITGINPELLTLGDRLYIMIWECAKSYTDIITVNTVCSHCVKQINANIDLRELNVITLPDGFSLPHAVTLPESKESVHLKFLSINDEIEAERFDEKNEDGLLYRCAKSMVDELDVMQRIEKLRVMNSKDISTIRAFQEKYYHGPDLKHGKFKCPKCGQEDVTEIPFRFDFLFPNGDSLTDTFGAGI